jgi:hypothetical protein
MRVKSLVALIAAVMLTVIAIPSIAVEVRTARKLRDQRAIRSRPVWLRFCAAPSPDQGRNDLRGRHVWTGFGRGLDKSLEAGVLDRMPDWLTAVTTRF